MQQSVTNGDFVRTREKARSKRMKKKQIEVISFNRTSHNLRRIVSEYIRTSIHVYVFLCIKDFLVRNLHTYAHTRKCILRLKYRRVIYQDRRNGISFPLSR